MDELICPESVQRNGGSNTAMVTQRLAALRSHGSRFWGVEEAIKPDQFASFREHLPSTDLSLRKA